MDCILAALLTCFSWSNLSLDTGISVQDVGTSQYFYRTETERFLNPQNAEIATTIRRFTSEYHEADNPYGRISLGYELSFRTVTWRLEASHVSSLAGSRDRGINALSLSARWYPFRDKR